MQKHPSFGNQGNSWFLFLVSRPPTSGPKTGAIAEISLDEPISRPVPPRSNSLAVPTQGLNGPGAGMGGRPHPSIFPPHTPHPLPATAESDRQYMQAQGTPLRSGVWGERGIDGSTAEEKFALVWSKRDQVWVAVYKMMIQVGVYCQCFTMNTKGSHQVIL